MGRCGFSAGIGVAIDFLFVFFLVLCLSRGLVNTTPPHTYTPTHHIACGSLPLELLANLWCGGPSGLGATGEFALGSTSRIEQSEVC